MHASKAIRISVTLIVAATAPSAFAKDGRVLFDQKVLRSDLIAVAEITSVASQGTNLQRGREYRSLANLKIIEGIKGSKTGDTVLLEYDNGLGCPNVLYSTGERCLVFACLMINGHYHTFNTYYGKALIEGDTSKGVAEGDLNGKLEGVIARIKGILDGNKI